MLGRRIDSFHVGFVLGPRLNAAGRMGSADIALDLLLMRGRDGDVKTRARALARQLSDDNTKLYFHGETEPWRGMGTRSASSGAGSEVARRNRSSAADPAPSP